MAQRRQFLIPVGWSEILLRGWPSDQLRSSTTVLVAQRNLGVPTSVECVSTPGSPHEKPYYRVQYAQRYTFIDRPVRLDRVKSGSIVLVELPVKRSTICFKWDGVLHGMRSCDTRHAVVTHCGFEPYLFHRDPRLSEVFEPDSTPDCPACLEVKKAWHTLYVHAYDHKREVLRKAAKQRRKERERERVHAASPSVFERLLLDDVLDPPPKPAPVRIALPEPDLEDVLPIPTREPKLRARRETGKLLKETLRASRKR